MKLDLEQIKALMEALKESGLSKLKIKQGEEELVLEHEVHVSMPVAAPAPVVAPVEAALPQAAQDSSTKPQGQFVTSPIVGTFYRSASPEADSFVEPGDIVNEDTVVAIVEAMKVMNELKAGVKGVIKEVLLDNGDPVEFGTQLFRVG